MGQDRLVIGDIGFAKAKAQMRHSTKFAGTILYQSPECIKQEDVFVESDVWYKYYFFFLKLIFFTSGQNFILFFISIFVVYNFINKKSINLKLKVFWVCAI